MRRRSFGQNGTVSAVGFGCMSFGGFYGPTTESETMRALARRPRARRRFLGHRQCLWRGRERDADRQVPGRGSGPPGAGHAGDQIRDSPPRRRDARLRQQPRPSAGKPGRVAQTARRRSDRSLLRPRDRPEHPDRGNRRRTRPPCRSRNNRRGRPLRGRARHAEAGRGACTRSPPCSRNIRSGHAIRSSG